MCGMYIYMFIHIYMCVCIYMCIYVSFGFICIYTKCHLLVEHTRPALWFTTGGKKFKLENTLLLPSQSVTI